MAAKPTASGGTGDGSDIDADDEDGEGASYVEGGAEAAAAAALRRPAACRRRGIERSRPIAERRARADRSAIDSIVVEVAMNRAAGRAGGRPLYGSEHGFSAALMHHCKFCEAAMAL